MLIHIEIAFNLELEIEATMMSKQLEHMIEETDSSGDLVMTAAFNDQGGVDVGLLGSSLNRGSSHVAATFFDCISLRVSRKACSSRFICSASSERDADAALAAVIA